MSGFREMASGKWRGILAQFGVDQRYLDGKHHACPSTGTGEDRFRFADRNGTGNFFCSCSDGRKGGIDLLMCCKGWDFATAAREVERICGKVKRDEFKPRRDPLPALRRVARLCRPIGKDVRDYLHGRGLQPPPFLKQATLKYFGDGWDVSYPAMVGLITGPDGRAQSYHLTYLDGGKKAEVPSPRKVMTPVETITGAAIRLYPEAESLGIAEGIETAIAASMLHGLPVWACISAGGIESFTPPDSVKHLTIFSDNDANYTGQSAAYSCAKRLERSGITCDVRIPDLGDWNDVLLRTRAAA